MKDYYAIPGVARDSSTRQVKRAYKKLARQWHPDLHPHDTVCKTRIREINEAYEVLGSPAKREDYDRRMREGGNLTAVREHFQQTPPSAFQSYFMQMNAALRRKSQKP